MNVCFRFTLIIACDVLSLFHVRLTKIRGIDNLSSHSGIPVVTCPPIKDNSKNSVKDVDTMKGKPVRHLAIVEVVAHIELSRRRSQRGPGIATATVPSA